MYDQGRCSSSYAHAAITAIEASVAIQNAVTPPSLSREQAKSCLPGQGLIGSQGSVDGVTGVAGCSGGAPGTIMEYGIDGLTTNKEYPYSGVIQAGALQSPCRYNSSTMKMKSKVGNRDPPQPTYITVDNNEISLKAALLNLPVVVSVYAIDEWLSYGGGIMDCPEVTSADQINHAAVVVGYGHDPSINSENGGTKYWLLQNSWGAGWGENGFIRIKREDSNSANGKQCGITIYNGLQANLAAPSDTDVVDCNGYWSEWTRCSAVCDGGTKFRMWTTIDQPIGGGAACPLTPEKQSCNTIQCTANCIKVSGSVSVQVDGIYATVGDWDQDLCGETETNQQYQMINLSQDTSKFNDSHSFLMFWLKTSCSNGVVSEGQWGYYSKGGTTAFDFSDIMAAGTSLLVATWTTSGSTTTTITQVTCPFTY